MGALPPVTRTSTPWRTGPDGGSSRGYTGPVAVNTTNTVRERAVCAAADSASALGGGGGGGRGRDRAGEARGRGREVPPPWPGPGPCAEAWRRASAAAAKAAQLSACTLCKRASK